MASTPGFSLWLWPNWSSHLLPFDFLGVFGLALTALKSSWLWPAFSTWTTDFAGQFCYWNSNWDSKATGMAPQRPSRSSHLLPCDFLGVFAA